MAKVTRNDRKTGIPADWASLYPNIVKSVPWLNDEIKNNGPNPILTMFHISDRIRQSDPEYRNHELAQLDSDLGELEVIPGVSRVISKMRNETEFFDERAVLWFGAKYKRQGFQVEFIPEVAKKQRPDIGLVDQDTDLKATVEVKHLDLEIPEGYLIQEIQKVSSRYVVDIRIEEELLYKNQADYLIRVIVDKIRDLSETTAEVVPYTERRPKRWQFDLIPNPDGELRRTAVRYLHWGRTVKIPKAHDRLIQLLDKARDQLLEYSPDSINVIAVYVDDSSIREDIAKETLYEDPGLFKSTDYRGITALQYVVQRVGHDEELFPNRNNEHFKNGDLESLKL